MQFIKNGPDIPDRLLQRHEDGKVVFFCGAGISYPAGLPGFKGLVEELYCRLREEPNPIEEAALDREQFDTVIGLLEGRIVGKRNAVREHLPVILKPKLSAPGATTTHEALITLARNRNGSLRLVTTNFDQLFEVVNRQKGFLLSKYGAPFLPVSKNRWDGIVYLHGFLPEEPSQDDLNQLVLSSGDFGLAYLVEAWAARFVSELFRNFTVCFVGYSINDPVLRYMTDALAADRLLGESTSEMFAFGGFAKGEETEQKNEWKAKNVVPILYCEEDDHRYLHETLRDWSEKYRDGIQGKEQVVVSLAGEDPLMSTEQDDFVGRMLWALSDPSGKPAKMFAEIAPVPSINWLKPLSENRFQHCILRLLDVQSLDRVLDHLASWLTRHLNDPQLALWVAERGGKVHFQFGQAIERKIAHLANLEQAGKSQELVEIQRAAPNAIPNLFMRTLWRLILGGRLKSSNSRYNLFRWRKRFSEDGLSLSVRIELRESLKPCLLIRRRLPWPNEHGATPQWEQLVDWEVILAAEHLHATIHDLQHESKWNNALPDLLFDFSMLLHDALNLMQELRGVEHRAVSSIVAQPSISEHSQNERYFEWTVLIDLTRDAWITMSKLHPTRALLIAEAWMWIPYPLFKRLAFFAATQNDVVPIDQALNWLLQDGNWWLWSIETQREAIRLLVELAPRLDLEAMARLELAILKGPPREMYRSDLEEDRWQNYVDSDVWLRLAKIDEAGAELGESAREKLDALSRRYPDWHLSIDHRDEFATWTESSADTREFIKAPREKDDLVEWLKKHPHTDPWYEDDWRNLCSEDFPTAADALMALAHEDIWPEHRWGTALLAWSEEGNLKISWDRLAEFFVNVPVEFIQKSSHELILWLLEQARDFEGQEECFFLLIRRILEMEHPDSEPARDSLVSQALYHPVGRVTEALMRWWYRRSLQDGDGLPDEMQPFLINLCDATIEKFRYGRIILAINLIALYRVDESWTTVHLLPLFDWQNSEAESRAAWQGFLLARRLYWPLLAAIKKSFLDTAGHFTYLDKHGEQYASLLAFTALDQRDIFSNEELIAATLRLPREGLNYVVNSLVQALAGAGEQRSNYWSNRVWPYLSSILPRSAGDISPEIWENCARLCITSGEAFPDALANLRHWLRNQTDDPQKTQRVVRLLYDLREAQLCSSFPTEALEFLDSLHLNSTHMEPLKDQLLQCLNDIRSGCPNLETDSRFRNLETLCQNS